VARQRCKSFFEAGRAKKYPASNQLLGRAISSFPWGFGQCVAPPDKFWRGYSPGRPPGFAPMWPGLQGP